MDQRVSFLRAPIVVVILAALLGCSHLEPSSTPRPPVPLPADLERVLRPPDASWGLELATLEQEEDYELLSLRFRCFGELDGDFRVVEGEYYRTRRVDPGAAAPLVVMSPILGGTGDDYLASRYFARCACERGISAMFLHQETVILDPRRDVFELERRLRQNIRDNIRAIDLLVTRPEVDAGRLGSIGISLGGIKNVVLIAADPRLSANVLCLAGIDLPEIILTSREPMVEEYLDGRREVDGLDTAGVAAELRRFLRCRPAYCAPSIASERVFLVLGRIDDKVPYRTGLALREALGGPATWVLPTGHYTTVLMAPWLADGVIDWLHRRWGAK
jgi:hypothetical protein